MKGTFLNQQIEYQLSIAGESWAQGESLNGSLKIINHSSSAFPLENIGFFLFLGVVKKIKAQDDSGIEIIYQENFKEKKLESKKDLTLPIKYSLTHDAHLSETTKSIYVSCGHKDNFLNIGYLPLKITPLKTIHTFLEIFSTFHKFKVKSLKTKKNFVEAVMVIPSSKDYTNVQKFKMLLRVQEENLEVNYLFNLKKIDFTESTNSLKSEKKEFSTTLTPKEYKFHGDSLNQDFILKSTKEILDQVKFKSFF